MYGQYIWQAQYQQKVKGHLRVCGNRESQNKNSRRSYETRLQQKFKPKLNKI